MCMVTWETPKLSLLLLHINVSQSVILRYRNAETLKNLALWLKNYGKHYGLFIGRSV